LEARLKVPGVSGQNGKKLGSGTSEVAPSMVGPGSGHCCQGSGKWVVVRRAALLLRPRESHVD